MTEEERLEELKRNPKVIVNQASKGKYKFMQKYYHRGVFFMVRMVFAGYVFSIIWPTFYSYFLFKISNPQDQEDEVYKRDFAKPTLEDHFDKSVLPKVMQVKNFGMSGQTKYTHLVDQDTTNFDSPWSKDSALTSRFYQKHAAGMKEESERPLKKRRGWTWNKKFNVIEFKIVSKRIYVTPWLQPFFRLPIDKRNHCEHLFRRPGTICTILIADCLTF